MEVMMIKTQGGALVPMNDVEAQKMNRWKLGGIVCGEFRDTRNGPFARKWWALVNVAYEMWADDMPEQAYLGQPVLPQFDRFRKDLIVMAGYFTPVYSAMGEMRLEADSISWAKMDEAKFQALYSATINVILGKVLAGKGMTEAKLRDAVDSVMRFA